jgi:hypothetical protein
LAGAGPYFSLSILQVYVLVLRGGAAGLEATVIILIAFLHVFSLFQPVYHLMGDISQFVHFVCCDDPATPRGV